MLIVDRPEEITLRRLAGMIQRTWIKLRPDVGYVFFFVLRTVEVFSLLLLLFPWFFNWWSVTTLMLMLMS